MTIRKIITVPDPILRTQARKIRSFTPELQYFISDLIETMRMAHGVGLAAPQVGIDKQVIVVEYSEEDKQVEGLNKSPKLYVVINPEIFHRSSEEITGKEACLSVPGFIGEVNRHQLVTVKGLNRHGRPFRLKARGWLARIFQHEIDHIHGRLYTDCASKVWRIRAKDEEFSLVI